MQTNTVANHRIFKATVADYRPGSNRLSQLSVSKLLIQICIGLFSLLTLGRLAVDYFDLQHVSISGGERYSEAEIFYASGLNPGQDLMLQISLGDLKQQIRRNLSYVKGVQIAKHNFARSLNIEVTERKPFAIVQDQSRLNEQFILVDVEGFVLEYADTIKGLEAFEARRLAEGFESTDTIHHFILAEHGNLNPDMRAQQVGTQIDSRRLSDFLLCRLVIELIKEKRPELLTKLRTIETFATRLSHHGDSVVLYCDNLPKIWLSANLIKGGLQNVGIFLRSMASEKYRFSRTSERKQLKVGTQPLVGEYLDFRFENVMYWGDKENGQR